MHRIDHATRAINLDGVGKDGFTAGDASASVPPTRVTVDWLNALNRELNNALEAVGITPRKTDDTQLGQSMAVRIEQAALANHLESNPSGSRCYGAAYGAGVYVMVGSSGQVFRSIDGDTWTSHAAGGGYSGTLQAVYYDAASALWVAVGDTGEIQTSPNGTAWTHRTKDGVYNGAFRGVTKAAGLFVIVGDSEEVQTSPNGTTWTRRRTAGAETIGAVAFGNGYFVAPRGSAGVLRSVDGITWTTHAHPDAQVTLVAFGAGVFVTWGDDASHWSVDGITWTLSVSLVYARHLIRGPNQFVATALNGILLLSPDGAHWRQLPVRTFGAVNFYAPVQGAEAIAFSTGGNTFRRSLFF
jgi:hypothetical protein